MNKENNIVDTNTAIKFSNNFIAEIKELVSNGRRQAYAAVNNAMLTTYWQIGKRIVEEEQNGRQRAEYGKQLLKQLSEVLTEEFGKGFSAGTLYYMRQFYTTFPEIFATPWRILSWSHYKRLMQVSSEEARKWYLAEASEQMWSYAFVLVDLKVGQITHQDVGQMEMYVNMFDETVRDECDNPTLGIVLCSETDADIARYMLNDKKNIFMSKYLLCLPSKEELRQEIERQKALFALQKQNPSDVAESDSKKIDLPKQH